MFNHKVIRVGRVENHVWEREPLSGNLVIVVIDDECGFARIPSDKVLAAHVQIFPLLREYACSWDETRAIGFFHLMNKSEHADRILDVMHTEWLNELTEEGLRVYFFVDDLYAGSVSVASNHTIERLRSSYSYPQDHIAYLTEAGVHVHLLKGYPIFRKGDEAAWAQRCDEFSPQLMSFLR